MRSVYRAKTTKVAPGLCSPPFHAKPSPSHSSFLKTSHFGQFWVFGFGFGLKSRRQRFHFHLREPRLAAGGPAWGRALRRRPRLGAVFHLPAPWPTEGPHGASSCINRRSHVNPRCSNTQPPGFLVFFGGVVGCELSLSEGSTIHHCA